MSNLRYQIALLGIIFMMLSCQPKEQFRLVNTSSSNLDFVNEIVENDSFNILDFEYVYNGGGVALADLNNDGLQDVFFTGNMVNNRLYLNRGGLKFQDITSKAQVAAEDKWCSGVAVIDINLDGYKDLYVSATTYSSPERRRNLLYINNGPDATGVPTFIERASEYRVDDDGHSVNAAFIDYDADGDMDLFVIANKMEDSKTPNVYRDREKPSPERVDKLYQNNWNEALGHPVFTDVSKEAGIIYEGYSLGVNITDINMDGFSDIYVTNDYLSRDLVYVNNGDGTFTNKADDYFTHTSYSAMGNDVVDMNNDGLPDMLALDMLPEDNYRRKTMLMNNNYTNYINNEKYDYQYQFVRNTFQVNQGINPESGDPVFSDQAFLAGVSCTDWSWTPLVADFDNDGLRDIIVTNGFPKDITDRDFADYNSEFGRLTKKATLLTKIPSVKIRNYAYRNVNGVSFEEVTTDWGIKYPSFSNGASYGDLDNDGDLDYIVSNINDPAFLFENLSGERDKNNNWLQIKLKGPTKNPMGLGTKIWVYQDVSKKYWEHSVYRGYLSSVQDLVHFGLGNIEAIDSIVVQWPSGYAQRFKNVKVNQVLTIAYENATPDKVSHRIGKASLMENDSTLMDYTHEEQDIIDFNIQPLLPHKLSQYGPGIAVSDINKDGLEDLYLGGSNFHKGAFMLREQDGSFRPAELFSTDTLEENHEDMGSLFFDADQDGDEDLYIVSGSNEAPEGDSAYRDRFYENVEGKFVQNMNAIPDLLTSGSGVRAADYDRDGDLDLFVGGRHVPFKYPKPAYSYILRNDSQNGSIQFSIDQNQKPFQEAFGMVSDALWTDFNGDGWMDLVVAGEWMPLRFIQNKGGSLEEITFTTGIQNEIGWWNSLTAGDFDRDGDIDYLAGNLGKNTLYEASAEYPIGVYGADFDGNGGFDMVPTVFLKNYRGELQEFPYFGRGDMIKQINKIRAQFQRYADFGQATINHVFTQAQLDSAISYKATYMFSSYIENQGDNTFRIKPLPLQCQIAPVFGMVTEDFNNDEYLDVLIVGNDYGSEVLQGRMDAMKGIMLQGNGSGSFDVVSMNESGFYVPGDAKALTYLVDSDGTMIVMATQNRGKVKIFKVPAEDMSTVVLDPNDYLVELQTSTGKIMKREIYYGHTFLSQSSRRIRIPKEASSIRITNFEGESKILTEPL